MSKPERLFELLLVRHAQSCGNAGIPSDDDVSGGQDTFLSPDGVRQAALLADRFARCPLDAIYSSGLVRAVQTACAVASAQPSALARRVRILPLLTECNVRADYGGYPIDRLRGMFPAAKIADGWQGTQTVLPSDDEADPAYNIERAEKALAYLKDRFQGGERVMVVAHGMFNTIFLMQALGVNKQNFDPDFANTSVTRLSFYKAGAGPWGFDVCLHELNDYAHLRADFPQMRYENKE